MRDLIIVGILMFFLSIFILHPTNLRINIEQPTENTVPSLPTNLRIL